MLKIRLQRIGRKGKPNYRIVVSEHSTAANKNSYVEQLGHYNPLAVGQSFEVNKDKVLEWIKKGAKPTNTLARLLKGDGVKDMEPYIIEMKDKKKKKAEEVKESAPIAEAKIEETPVKEVKEEAPVEEVKEEAPAEPAPEAPIAEAKIEETPAEEVKEEAPAEPAPEAPAEGPKEEEKKEEEKSE